jgi:DNA-binding transcriptional MerR regulator
MIESDYYFMAPWTLTEAAKLLGAPQHKLIHLCEKKVVVPDVRDARGRGSSREFSKRNLFDFAVALEMRRLELPVSFVQAVLRVLRSFEAEVKSTRGEFTLPESLVTPSAAQLTLIILDGERLYFRLDSQGTKPRVFGGVDIRHPRVRGRARHHLGVGRLGPAEAGRVLSAARTRTEVNLSQIARDLAAHVPEG